MYNTTLYNFCLTSSVDNIQIHFNPNGADDNDFNKWISDDLIYSVIWNNTINRWQVTGGTLDYSMYSGTEYPPLNGWYILGSNGSVNVNEGACAVLNTNVVSVNLNQPLCSCDGSIIVNTSGGYPPYLYSIDNGVSYVDFPLFTNLCSGLYTVKVVDLSGNTLTSPVILNPPTPPTTYSLKLSTTSTNIVNTPITMTTIYSSVVNVSPTLPDGVTLIFDLIHNDLFTISPSGNTATIVTNSVMTKNEVTQILSGSNTTTGATNFNLTQGCQDLILYQTGLTENWNNVSMTNSDTIVINTTTTINKNVILNPCDVATSNDYYSINNVSISGCGCCNVIIT